MSTYMVSIQLDVFDGCASQENSWTQAEESLKRKIYYDLVELTPDQIKSIIKMIAILSRGAYDPRLPKQFEE